MVSGHRPSLNDIQNEIRLLELPENVDADFSLSVHSLNSEPEYCALSYCWGTEEASTSILIDGADFPIRPNLKEALVQLVKKALPRFIWIDAICIDQENVLEKSHQVRAMRRIYQQAKLVYVWLGPEDVDSELAMYPYTASYMQHELTEKHFQTDALLYIMYLFTQRPWWTRVWVLQEVAYAKSVHVLCGDGSLEWNQLLLNLGEAGMLAKKVYNYLHEGKSTKLITSLKAESVMDALQFSTYFGMFVAEFPESRLPLLHLLELHREKLCLDGRDKLFTLLGLATEEDQLWHAIDYSLNLTQVYSRLTIRLIEQSQRLEIFGHIWPATTNTELPSWVPDWTDSSFKSSYITGFRQNGGAFKSLFAAGGSQPLAISFSADGLSLGLKGRIWGIVTFSLGLSPIRPRCSLRGLLYLWLLVFSLAVGRGCPETGTELTKIFVRVMACDILEHLQGVRKEDAKTCQIAAWIENRKFVKEIRADSDCSAKAEAVLKLFTKLLNQLMDDNDAQDPLWDYFASDEEIKHCTDLCNKWNERCEKTGKGRSLLLVNDNMFGLGPETAKNKDIVFIPLGSDVPLIIRNRQSGDYVLVGECYLDGIMDGEAMQDIENNDELKTIILH